MSFVVQAKTKRKASPKPGQGQNNLGKFRNLVYTSKQNRANGCLN